MCLLRTYSFLLAFLIPVLFIKSSYAQSLKGKIIYISVSAEISLKFRSGIKSYNLTAKDVENPFQIKFINNKTISLSNNTENFKSNGLIINEGENTHLFILEYKPVIDLKTETFYNYSNKDSLKKEAARLEEIAKISINDPGTNTNTSPPPTSPPVVAEVKLTPKEIDDNFISIRTDANNAYSAQKYDEARELYLSALKLKPKDVWCLAQLDAIENKKGKKVLQNQQKMSLLSFQTHLYSADSALKQKSYRTATSEYNEALAEKPNDPYVVKQLKLIDVALKNDSYNSFMNSGREALSDGLYDNAILAFNEALKLRPNDIAAKKELIKVNQAKVDSLKKANSDLINTNRQNVYNDTLSLADNMFEAGMYEEARKKYRQADKIKPGLPYHAKKIASIDSILLKRKTEHSKLKQDSLTTIAYNREIEKGNSAFDAKDFKKAKSAFQLAQSLQPNEKLPAERLSAIGIMLSHLEEAKKAEIATKVEQDKITKQYNYNMSRGNNALKTNDYIGAKSFFAVAKQLKPDEKLPISQLVLVDGKLEDILNGQRYEQFIHIGDSTAFIAKNHRAALRWFDSALVIKPNEARPKKQIIAINQIILKADSLQMEKESEKIRTAAFNEALPSYKTADAARLQGKYSEAYTKFGEFLSKIDMPGISKYSSMQAYHIKQATDFLGRLERFKPDPIADSIRQAHITDSLNNINKKGKRKRK